MSQPLERELKYWPADLRSLRESLAAAGARLLFSCPVKNEYFDFPGRPRDTLFRLRTAGRCAWLTAKGPRRPSNAKVRLEHEAAVASPRLARELMFRTGAKPAAAEERWREEWELPGGVRAAVDRLPHPGVPLYVEIEAPDESSLRSAAARLGLDSLRNAPITFEELCRLFGISFHEAARPLPPSMRLRSEAVEPDCEPVIPAGGIISTSSLAAPTGAQIVVERRERGGFALFDGKRLAVSEPHELEAVLKMLGCIPKGHQAP